MAVTSVDALHGRKGVWCDFLATLAWGQPTTAIQVGCCFSEDAAACRTWLTAPFQCSETRDASTPSCAPPVPRPRLRRAGGTLLNHHPHMHKIFRAGMVHIIAGNLRAKLRAQHFHGNHFYMAAPSMHMLLKLWQWRHMGVYIVQQAMCALRLLLVVASPEKWSGQGGIFSVDRTPQHFDSPCFCER
ncbi:hypothetical protein EJ07DRAFT_160048 [Lizonia empirigonia]|nr:hypothetical protein EJ07DRAFT_160048 [Lizonia empirigonia]